MSEVKIALADGGKLQFNQSFLQFIGIKKTYAKSYFRRTFLNLTGKVE